MPKKKIYDVKPPKFIQKTEEGLREFFAEPQKKSRYKRKREGRSIWLPVSIAAGIVLFGVCIYLFFKLPKADVIIWPKVDTLSFHQTITADESVDLPDVAKNVIPAQYLELSKTVSQDFPATGNAENVGRTSGTITVYNKYDPPTPLTLKAGTRFISDSGKLFLALQKFTVPAANKSGSRITPGSVQVKVQAAEGGESYNIASANFSIPGLKGTAYYYTIYATSSDAMTGGYSSSVKKVTDNDIQSAKDVLTRKAAQEAISQLKTQVPSDSVLLDNAVSTAITSASTKTKAGTVVENFNYQAIAKASAIIFKKSDLDRFAKECIISKMPDDKTLLDSSYKINYSASVVDISGKKITLELDFSSGIYRNIDKNSLSLSLLGKNASQIDEVVTRSLGDNLSKIKVDFWPFWVSKAPNAQKAIKIELKFE